MPSFFSFVRCSEIQVGVNWCFGHLCETLREPTDRDMNYFFHLMSRKRGEISLCGCMSVKLPGSGVSIISTKLHKDRHQPHLEGLWNHRVPSSTPRVFSWVGLRWGLRTSVSNKFPGEAGATGIGSMLWEPLPTWNHNRGLGWGAGGDLLIFRAIAFFLGLCKISVALFFLTALPWPNKPISDSYFRKLSGFSWLCLTLKRTELLKGWVSFLPGRRLRREFREKPLFKN